jgi:hypothetical protein
MSTDNLPNQKNSEGFSLTVYGNIIEPYEYDVYGQATIFNASDVELAASATATPTCSPPAASTPKAATTTTAPGMYSPSLGRFLSVDPLGFDAGDYNLYRYAFNNPANLTDPTGEFAIIPFLLSATIEAGVDALSQMVINYYFDPTVTTWDA